MNSRKMVARCCMMVVTFVACSEKQPATTDSSAGAPAPSVVIESPRPAVPGARRDACPHTGMWANCSVERRLRQSGFVVKRVEGDAPSRAGFSVTPTAYMLGQARLEVFLYESEKALAKDVANMDTVLVGPKGAPSKWESPPTFIRSANLIAVLLTTSPIQAERAMLALTAGAPQPGSPR